MVKKYKILGNDAAIAQLKFIVKMHKKTGKNYNFPCFSIYFKGKIYIFPLFSILNQRNRVFICTNCEFNFSIYIRNRNIFTIYITLP